MGLNSKQILQAYSKRWIIENGIKDLSHSFNLDQVPGTRPHHVNVHFFMVGLCRVIYQMTQKDSGDLMVNSDGTYKTLSTMRDKIINPCSGKFQITEDTIEINLLSKFSAKMTDCLRQLFNTANEQARDGLEILGGYKLNFRLLPPYGEERRNINIKVPLEPPKKFQEKAEMS